MSDILRPRLLAAVAAALVPLAVAHAQQPPAAGTPSPARAAPPATRPATPPATQQPAAAVPTSTPAGSPPAPQPGASLPPAATPAEAPAAPSAAAAPAGMERLTFAAAIARAAGRNPNALIAADEIARADAIMHEVRAGLIPALTGTALYTHLDGDRVQVNTDGSSRVLAADNQVSANGILTVPLVAPRNYTAWKHARTGVEVTRFAERDVNRQVALATARAYLTVIAARRFVQVAELARDTARAHLDFARARRQGGIGNRIDEVRAAQEVATDEAAVQASSSSLVRAREALGVLLGGDHPVDSADEPELASPPPLAEALAQAAERRTDVRLARERLAAAEQVLDDSWADYLPSLTGALTGFYQHPATLTVPETGWQATLNLSIPFYDGGLRAGQRHERRALVSEARTALDAAVRQAQADVRVAYETWQRADATLASAREAARLSHEALDMATLAYRTGATTNLELIDAERHARDADAAATQAEDNARQARVDLLAASGLFP